MTRAHRHHVLVLGGGYAGLAAAARAAHEPHADVTLVDARDAFVQRIRLHELLAGRESATMPYASTLHRRGIRFVHGLTTTLDVAGQRAGGRTADGVRWSRGWDTLVIALGSRTATDVPGVDAHAIRLDDPMSVRAAATRLAALPARAHVVVVGGGATGIEAITELADRYPHLRLTLLAAGRIDAAYAPAAGAWLRAALARRGIEVREDAPVAAVHDGAVTLAAGASLPCDACVWTAGFAATALARHAGLPVARDGRVLVDATLRVPGHENVFVAGDAAGVTSVAGGVGDARLGSVLLRMGCATAMPIGAHAGSNVRRAIAGRPLEPFDFGYLVRCVSLGRREGLIQLVDEADRPTGHVMTGGRGALVKELVSRSTWWGTVAEARLGLPVTSWRKPGRRDAAKDVDLVRAA